MSRPLRIIFYDPSGHGGICHYTYQLAENLAQLGHAVTVITTDAYELKQLARHFRLRFLFRKSRIKSIAACFLCCRAPRGSAPVANAAEQRSWANGTGGIAGVLRLFRLRWFLFKMAIFLLWNPPDIFHVQWLIDRHEDYRLIRFLKLFGLRVVYTAHDILPQETDARADKEIIGKIYHKVDALVVHAHASKEEIVHAFNLDRRKVHVIPHGSYDLFGATAGISKDIARQELGILPAQKVILFFGIIKRYKGLEYLVEAFQEIEKHLRDALLLVVGSIYEGDVEGFQYYSKLIDAIRGRDSVICVPRYLRFDEIGRYFCAADVVVLPYTKTYTSGVLLAAYAAGRPVVVTDTGALPEVVEPGKSGLVVPPRDPQALSRAVIEMFTASNIDSMGRHARELADTRYSWKNVATETVGLYRSLAAGA